MNKKALDQFQSFTDQRADLVRRTQENDRSEEKIRELIGTLDLRKDEAIERTFKVVAAPLLPHAARGWGVLGEGRPCYSPYTSLYCSPAPSAEQLLIFSEACQQQVHVITCTQHSC